MTNEEAATKENPRIFGPGYYKEVGRQILDQGLEVRVGDELISYAYDIITKKNFPDFSWNPWNYPKDQSDLDAALKVFDKEVLNEESRSFKAKYAGNNGHWMFQHYLFTEDGIFVVHDRQVSSEYKFKDLEKFGPCEGQQKLRFMVEQLQERVKGGKKEKGVVFSPDGSTRFAPWNTLTRIERGDHYFRVVHPPSRDNYYQVLERRTLRAEEIPNDGFVIASVGVLGAMVLAGIVERSPSKTFSYRTSLYHGAIAQDVYTLGVNGNEYHSFHSLSFGELKGCATPK